MEFRARNTNDLSAQVYHAFQTSELVIEQTSRNGPVKRFNRPVMVLITRPTERVNTCPIRDANPFFHFMEGLAMLNADNDIKFLAHYASNMMNFSDDGETQNAFYGTRARRSWGDQISAVIEELGRNPESRQCVVQLWDPNDLWKTTKDKACNLTMLFEVRDGKINMTTFNRSNDAVLGMVSGANVVHLSMFQEYVAMSLSLPVGVWWHVSNNFHVYTEQAQWKRFGEDYTVHDWYSNARWQPMQMFDGASTRHNFDIELKGFMAIARTFYKDPGSSIAGTNFTANYFSRLAIPMFNAWQAHKRKDDRLALTICDSIEADDWCFACKQWLQRRLK